jgi:hypothetical protein
MWSNIQDKEEEEKVVKSESSILTFLNQNNVVIREVQSILFNNLQRANCQLSSQCLCCFDFKFHAIEQMKSMAFNEKNVYPKINVLLFLEPNVEWENEYKIEPQPLPDELRVEEEEGETTSKNKACVFYGTFMKSETVQIKSTKNKFNVCTFSFRGIPAVIKYDLDCKLHRCPSAEEINNQIQNFDRCTTLYVTIL